MEVRVTDGSEVANDVAVGVEETDRRHRPIGAAALTTPFTQEVLDLEHRLLVVRFREQDRRSVDSDLTEVTGLGGVVHGVADPNPMPFRRTYLHRTFQGLIIEAVGAQCLGRRGRVDGRGGSMHQTLHEHRTIDAVLADARSQLDRWRPVDAWAATQTGEALIIDIRTPTDRGRDGVIPGSLHLPRTVLEWRVDPTSPRAHPAVGGYERRLVIVCNEGYSSSLAAVALHQLGFTLATDIVDGIRGWQAAGLPLVEPAPLPEGLRDGDGPPEPLTAGDPATGKY